MLLKRIAFVLAILLWGLSPSVGQESNNEADALDLSLVLCPNVLRPDDPTQRKVVWTPLLVSPDGQTRAYAQVRTFGILRTKEVGEGHRCANRSALMIQDSKEEAFEIAYLVEPSPWLLGNGIRLVDWSPEGRYLAMEIWRWQYESDVGSNAVLVYDAHAKAFLELRHDVLFEKRFAKECFTRISLQGFIPEGDILFRAEDNPMLGSDCVQDQPFWQFRPYDRALKPATGASKPTRYGMIESNPGDLSPSKDE